MKKEKFFFIAIIFLTLTGYIFDFLTKKETAQLYNEFYNADLNGKIEKVGIKRHGAGVKLSNNPKEFVFYPGSSLNGNNDFLDFADRGDK
jgi:hypothetical protein